jgi:choice-of-anchor B domain-containing protein
MKVIGHHVYIGSEAAGHGLQVFDLKKLLHIRHPKTFNITRDLTAWFRGFGSSHNIIANKESDTIFAVGAGKDGVAVSCSNANAGLIMVDVSDPSNPTLAGCNGDDGYVHDAQCVTYSGVDKDFNSHEICFGYNEDTLTIYDVTNKANSSIISRTSYTGFSYTHQGWNVDPDFRYLLLDDELDEYHGDIGYTTTYVFNISSLAHPVWTGKYVAPQKSIDHNQYIIDYISYQANYASGLRVLDVKSVLDDPSGNGIKEVAHFDCYPEDDDRNLVHTVGAWSVYPYFESGNVVLNCIERGLFSLKVNI